MRLIFSIALILFTAVVILGAIIFLVMEGLDKVESVKQRVPWLARFIEKRESFNVLFVLCIVMLIGNGYELLTKEAPEIPAPPIVKILTPPAPIISAPEHRTGERRRPSEPLSPAPQVAHVRLASQEQVVSVQEGFPYGLRVVLQTDEKIQPFSIRLKCTGAIGEVIAGPQGGGPVRATQGFLEGRSDEWYVFTMEDPAFTPDKSMIITIFSKTSIRVESFEILSRSP